MTMITVDEVTFCFSDLRGWRTMESAPRDGTKILVYTFHGTVELTEYFIHEQEVYTEVDGGLFKKSQEISFEGWNGNYPILWHPLPDLPEGAA